ncbi:MAG: hypothetical protein H0V07_06420, partial [Propionibacteriales bacterium]|nr:hypothetical protein [Propionibacteriales bacterium]
MSSSPCAHVNPSQTSPRPEFVPQSALARCDDPPPPAGLPPGSGSPENEARPRPSSSKPRGRTRPHRRRRWRIVILRCVVRQSRACDYPFFDNGGDPIGFAHRGGALTGDASGLENSMVAFQAAVDLGYRYVETDVHATKDGVLVAFHDPTLERTTDADGLISDLTYGELASVKIGGRESIPRLSDLFSTWPDLRINIDAKSATSVAPLARAIAQHRAWDRVCVASFSARHLRLLRRLLGPRVATSHSVVGVAALRALPTAALRRLAVGPVG